MRRWKQHTPVLVAVGTEVVLVDVEEGTLVVLVVVELDLGRYWMPVLGHEPGAGAFIGTNVPSMIDPRRL
jgi:hypothetical protein